MIDIPSIQVFDNPPDEMSWPATMQLTAIEFRPDGVHVDGPKISGPNRWPDVPFGQPGDSLQYTIGFVRLVGVPQPAASAASQFWFGLQQNGGDVLAPNQISSNWYYDGRWGTLQGWNPVPGEHVGLLVVAGNVRNVLDGSQSPVKERADLVELVWPSTHGALTPVWTEGSAPPPPPNIPELLAEQFDAMAAACTAVARILRSI